MPVRQLNFERRFGFDSEPEPELGLDFDFDLVPAFEPSSALVLGPLDLVETALAGLALDRTALEKIDPESVQRGPCRRL